MSSTVSMDEKATAEIELEVEEIEEVIAPKCAGCGGNHNETLVSDEVELNVEEIEEVIAPGTRYQHNETLVSD